MKPANGLPSSHVVLKCSRSAPFVMRLFFSKCRASRKFTVSTVTPPDALQLRVLGVDLFFGFGDWLNRASIHSLPELEVCRRPRVVDSPGQVDRRSLPVPAAGRNTARPKRDVCRLFPGSVARRLPLPVSHSGTANVHRCIPRVRSTPTNRPCELHLDELRNALRNGGSPPFGRLPDKVQRGFSLVLFFFVAAFCSIHVFDLHVDLAFE